MLNKFISWIREVCPYCHKKMVSYDRGHYHSRACPDGQYKIETHPHLEVEIEYHSAK
ncbi:hypothetical protein [Effusibacillus dendaii]|uniref:Uncharacterized protein n=1 Tax=Effusibacillus dendaii TaxID=2743772 RepID=A0A7I8DH97_9BACL|nr:hypothetical protein [Effusibacillus dendaii]BCJ88276.1 hypothetical protein skT53_32610 [Effusibacillus dendaii]